jgi:predicted transcriptional regulator
MATTIQISDALQKRLAERKLSERETYEEVISALIEDATEISEETKKELQESRAEARKGKVHAFSSIKKEAGL